MTPVPRNKFFALRTKDGFTMRKVLMDLGSSQSQFQCKTAHPTKGTDLKDPPAEALSANQI